MKDQTNVGSITCAQACFNDSMCEDGWSYQIATKTCNFYKNLEGNVKQKVFQPSIHIHETNKTVGWATGRKGCSQIGKNLR